MSDAKLKNVRTTAAAQAPAAKPAGGNIEVTDKRGRAIVVKRLNALDKMRLSRLVGAEGSVNQAYFGYAMMAASVVSIDGDPEPFPQSLLAIESMVSQLDDDGMDAVSDAFVQLNGGGTLAEDVASAKN